MLSLIANGTPYNGNVRALASRSTPVACAITTSGGIRCIHAWWRSPSLAASSASRAICVGVSAALRRPSRSSDRFNEYGIGMARTYRTNECNNAMRVPCADACGIDSTFSKPDERNPGVFLSPCAEAGMTLYRGMDRVALDAAYNNSAAVTNSGELLADFQKRSDGVRAEHNRYLDLRYGPAERNRIDYFPAA